MIMQLNGKQIFEQMLISRRYTNNTNVVSIQENQKLKMCIVTIFFMNKHNKFTKKKLQCCFHATFKWINNSKQVKQSKLYYELNRFQIKVYLN